MHRGRNIVDEYKEVGLSEDRYLLRIPATWEGIQAAKQLEDAGIATHLVLVYRCLLGLLEAILSVDLPAVPIWVWHRACSGG